MSCFHRTRGTQAKEEQLWLLFFYSKPYHPSIYTFKNVWNSDNTNRCPVMRLWPQRRTHTSLLRPPLQRRQPASRYWDSLTTSSCCWGGRSKFNASPLLWQNQTGCNNNGGGGDGCCGGEDWRGGGAVITADVNLLSLFFHYLARFLSKHNPRLPLFRRHSCLFLYPLH